MSKANPYQSAISGDNQNSDKPIILRGFIADEFWFNHNDLPAPKDVAAWIAKATDAAVLKGFKNLRVEVRVNPGDENNLESEYLVLKGDRQETDKEFKGRVANVRLGWLRKFEEYLREHRFYQSEMGQAQIKEGLKADAPNLVKSVLKQSQGDTLAHVATSLLFNKAGIEAGTPLFKDGKWTTKADKYFAKTKARKAKAKR